MLSNPRLLISLKLAVETFADLTGHSPAGESSCRAEAKGDTFTKVNKNLSIRCVVPARPK